MAQQSLPVNGDLMESASANYIYSAGNGSTKTAVSIKRLEVVVVIEVKYITYDKSLGCWIRVTKM